MQFRVVVFINSTRFILSCCVCVFFFFQLEIHCIITLLMLLIYGYTI